VPATNYIAAAADTRLPNLQLSDGTMSAARERVRTTGGGAVALSRVPPPSPVAGGVVGERYQVSDNEAAVI